MNNGFVAHVESWEKEAKYTKENKTTTATTKWEFYLTQEKLKINWSKCLNFPSFIRVIQCYTIYTVSVRMPEC